MTWGLTVPRSTAELRRNAICCSFGNGGIVSKSHKNGNTKEKKKKTTEVRSPSKLIRELKVLVIFWSFPGTTPFKPIGSEKCHDI